MADTTTPLIPNPITDSILYFSLSFGFDDARTTVSRAIDSEIERGDEGMYSLEFIDGSVGSMSLRIVEVVLVDENEKDSEGKSWVEIGSQYIIDLNVSFDFILEPPINLSIFISTAECVES